MKQGRSSRTRNAMGVVAIAASALLSTSAGARAEPSAEELAKLAQNPIGNLISIPFQNNTNLNAGPQEKTQNILNIQPVIPIEVNADWNVITRTIIPVISQPGFPSGDERTNGVGATQISAFLSPSRPKGGVIWGAGVIAQVPTTSDSALGSYRWGLGPTFVMLHLDPTSPWVYGVLVNNVWSVGGSSGSSYNNLLVQPFLNYNLPGGTYLTSSPVITANWRAGSGDRWTVPIGVGIGHIFRVGKLPLNTQIGAYYNVERPQYAPDWQIRAQAQVMFPK